MTEKAITFTKDSLLTAKSFVDTAKAYADNAKNAGNDLGKTLNALACLKYAGTISAGFGLLSCVADFVNQLLGTSDTQLILQSIQAVSDKIDQLRKDVDNKFQVLEDNIIAEIKANSLQTPLSNIETINDDIRVFKASPTSRTAIENLLAVEASDLQDYFNNLHTAAGSSDAIGKNLLASLYGVHGDYKSVAEAGAYILAKAQNAQSCYSYVKTFKEQYSWDSVSRAYVKRELGKDEIEDIANNAADLFDDKYKEISDAVNHWIAKCCADAKFNIPSLCETIASDVKGDEDYNDIAGKFTDQCSDIWVWLDFVCVVIPAEIGGSDRWNFSPYLNDSASATESYCWLSQKRRKFSSGKKLSILLWWKRKSDLKSLDFTNETGDITQQEILGFSLGEERRDYQVNYQGPPLQTELDLRAFSSFLPGTPNCYVVFDRRDDPWGISNPIKAACEIQERLSWNKSYDAGGHHIRSFAYVAYVMNGEDPVQEGS